MTADSVEFIEQIDPAPTPGLIEYKKVIEPVKVVAEDILHGKVKVTNHYDFISLAHLAVSWSLNSLISFAPSTAILIIPSSPSLKTTFLCKVEVEL